jgi:hypothetical protein
MGKAAAATRFEWTQSVNDYLKQLYKVSANSIIAD